MSDATHKKLLAFVAGECARTQHRSVVKLELFCAAVGARGESVRTWEREENPAVFELDNVHQLVSDVITTAQSYADGLGGASSFRFKVVTTQHLGGVARTFLRIAPEESGEEAGRGEDEPTSTGIVAQALRHSEAMMQTMLRSNNAMMQTLARRVEASEEQVLKLLEDRRAAQAELEEARGGQHEREMALMTLAGDEKRKEQGFEKLTQLAPVVVNRLMAGKAGGKILPEAQTPKEMMLANLSASLGGDPERLQRIMQSLAPHLQAQELIALVELLRQPASSQPAPDAVNGHNATEGS